MNDHSLLRQHGRTIARGFVALVLLAAVGYLAVVTALYVGQERIIFPASTLPADHRFRFAQPFREVRVPVPGAELDALHFTQPEPRGLVFFLHGNAGDLSTWTSGVDFYQRVNYDLFIFDYRGYGRSTGKIESEAQLHADVRAAWDLIAPRYRSRNLPIVIYGRSLGTGLAATLAREVDPALVMLVTPYVSVAAASRRAYPFVPGWALRYPMRTDAVIGEVKSPILLVHGTQDRLIPLSDSEQLRTLARSPTTLLVIEGAGHNDIHQFPTYLDGLAAALDRVAQPGP